MIKRMLLCVCVLSLAVSLVLGVAEDSIGVIGGADGPTSIYLSGEDAFSLIEAQLPGDDFAYMDDEALANHTSGLSQIAGAYYFVGRTSAALDFSYILGVRAREDDPFEGLSSWSVYDDDGKPTERLFYDDTGEVAFEITGATVLRSQGAPIIFVLPYTNAQINAYAVFNHVLGGDTEYLADASARGVYLVKPEAPYLCVSRYDMGVWRVEYIKLNRTQLNFTQVDTRAAYPQAVIGEYSIYLVTDEAEADEASSSNAPVPAYFVELAREKCAFEVATPGDIGDIVSATMTIGQGDAARSLTVSDPALLGELGDILRRSWYTGLSKCPYSGVLRLTMADDRELTVHKSTDSCATLIFGSLAGYEISSTANQRFWEIFAEIYR